MCFAETTVIEFLPKKVNTDITLECINTFLLISSASPAFSITFHETHLHLHIAANTILNSKLTSINAVKKRIAEH